MKYIKYFESILNEDETIEYLSDLLLDVKDTDEWRYDVLYVSGDEHVVKIESWFGGGGHLFPEKFDCYKIVIEPTIDFEYSDDNFENGSRINESFINAINACISYMKDYELQITTKKADHEYEYKVDDIKELSNDPKTNKPINYFEFGPEGWVSHIIIRFKK